MSELCVTVKYGKGYEETWAVFRSETFEAMREDLLGYFGLDPEDVKDLTLNELVLNVTALAHTTSNAVTKLGGKVISSKANPVAPKASKSDEAQQPTGDAAWAEAEKPAEPEVNPMLARIETVADTTELKVLWAENQDAFADPEVMAAWKAKGKALSKVAA